MWHILRVILCIKKETTVNNPVKRECEKDEMALYLTQWTTCLTFDHTTQITGWFDV